MAHEETKHRFFAYSIRGRQDLALPFRRRGWPVARWVRNFSFLFGSGGPNRLRRGGSDPSCRRLLPHRRCKPFCPSRRWKVSDRQCGIHPKLNWPWRWPMSQKGKSEHVFKHMIVSPTSASKRTPLCFVFYGEPQCFCCGAVKQKILESKFG